MRVRTKLAVSIAGIAAAASLALGLTVHEVTQRTRQDQARQVLAERLELAARAYGDTGSLTLGTRLDDPGLPAPLRTAAHSGQLATYLDEAADGSELWAATSVLGRVMSAHTSFESEQAGIRELDRTIMVAGTATVITTTLLAIMIAASLGRRLSTAAATAREVAGGALDARTGFSRTRRPRDEVTDLAGALDGMAAALQARIEAEQRVTADIAHDLRTPVAGLVTAAELLPPSRGTELVRDRVAVLRTLVEDVLEVARLDADVEVADNDHVSTAELGKRCAAASGAELRVLKDAQVSTDPRRVERIVSNLVANGLAHGEPPVVITVDGPVLRVRDRGPGYPPELLETGPRRFRTAAPARGRGHGLGLTIATGQAGVLGASLTFANHEDGGAIATLRLPD